MNISHPLRLPLLLPLSPLSSLLIIINALSPNSLGVAEQKQKQQQHLNSYIIVVTSWSLDGCLLLLLLIHRLCLLHCDYQAKPANKPQQRWCYNKFIQAGRHCATQFHQEEPWFASLRRQSCCFCSCGAFVRILMHFNFNSFPCRRGQWHGHGVIWGTWNSRLRGSSQRGWNVNVPCRICIFVK